VCERAGLIAQSILASSARAVTLSLAGKSGPAREAAEEAVELAERLHYPIGRAAALEADGATTSGPEAIERLRKAYGHWESLGRPLDAARCLLLIGRAQRAEDPIAAAETLEDAQATYERLGIVHQAERARELASAA
jgi:hypothetical protein